MATILIVEDDAFINMEAVFMVEALGHVTLSAHDVDQALAILHSQTHIDALFTDIRLKDRHLGGYEVAKAATMLRPGICVLYASGNRLADPSTGLVLAGSHFLQKPYGDLQLQPALVATLRSASAQRPTV